MNAVLPAVQSEPGPAFPHGPTGAGFRDEIPRCWKQPPAPAIYESTGTRGSREERVRQTRGRRPARYLAGETAAACVNQFQLATRS
jgi:hypothetical protein